MKTRNVTYAIGRRLTLGGANRTAAVIAIAGVACAVAVMLLTLAVGSGFKRGIRQKLDGFVAPVTVGAPYSYLTGRQASWLPVDTPLVESIQNIIGPETEIDRAVRVGSVLKTNSDFAAITLNGFDHGHDWSFVRDAITVGSFPKGFDSDTSSAIILPRPIASKLGLKPGERLTACFVTDSTIRARRLTVAAIYATGFGDYDRNIAYAPAALLREVSDIPRTYVSQLELRGSGLTPETAPDAAAILQQTLLNTMAQREASVVPVVDNVANQGAMYLNWLSLLDTNIVVIFAIMAIVAACTLVSSLFILILNNVTAIGILRTLGLTRNGIREVFVSLAMRLVVAGTLIGTLFALVMICLQGEFNLIPLDPEMYYLSAVPVHIAWWTVLIVDAAALLGGWFILYLPSRLAASISPASAMRYE